MKLSKEIIKAIDIMGYQQLTPIQKSVIPYLLEDRDIVAKAKTGSGKTASFAIPLCEKIIWDKQKPQALILACTRELVMQIQKEVSDIGKFKKIKSAVIIGKEKMSYQISELKNKCHIVVATPGRLVDHIENGSIDLSEVRYVIIDEADYMLDMGFVEQVEAILSILPIKRVTALFSATYPQGVQSLITKYTMNAIFIENEEEAQIEHYYVKARNMQKALRDTLSSCVIESSIIFCNQQEEVEQIVNYLKENGLKVSKIHGGMQQKDRNINIEKFRYGKNRLLVATDVASRGLDIEKVSHVIHYGIPKTLKEYIHRCGRSGRIDEKGISIIVTEEENALMQDLKSQFKLKVFEVKKKLLALSQLNESVQKQNKEAKWKGNLSKLYFNVGKDKKIRVVDIIGSLCSIEGVCPDDIGVVSVLQKMTFVEVLNGKENIIIDAYIQKKIKNKKVRVELANK